MSDNTANPFQGAPLLAPQPSPHGMPLEQVQALSSFTVSHASAWGAFIASQDTNPHNPKPCAVGFAYSQQWGGWLLTMAMPCGREYTVSFRDYCGSVLAILSPWKALVLTPTGEYIGAGVPANPLA